MTAQCAERLYLDRREVPLWTTPLSQYAELAGIEFPFAMDTTALWRCYIGTWELTAKHLYLVGIDASFRDGRCVGLSDLFPGFEERVFAHWFTGVLEIPEGELIERYHGGFGGTPERERLIGINRGVEVWRHIRVNTMAPTSQGA